MRNSAKPHNGQSNLVSNSPSMRFKSKTSHSQEEAQFKIFDSNKTILHLRFLMYSIILFDRNTVNPYISCSIFNVTFIEHFAAGIYSSFNFALRFFHSSQSHKAGTSSRRQAKKPRDRTITLPSFTHKPLHTPPPRHTTHTQPFSLSLTHIVSLRVLQLKRSVLLFFLSFCSFVFICRENVGEILGFSCFWLYLHDLIDFWL